MERSWVTLIFSDMKNLQNLAITKTDQGLLLSFPLGITAMSTGLKMLDYLYENLLKLKISFLTNITSYTIIICNLEKLIGRSYKEFIRVLKSAKYKNYHLDKNEINKRKKEIQDFKLK